MQEGIYESIINKAIKAKLDQLSADRFYIHTMAFDPSEAATLLANYLNRLINLALRELKEENSVARQIAFSNELIHYRKTSLP